MTFEEQLAQADGSRFQAELYEVIKREKPTVIVEIGSGVSSLFILKALDDAEIDGKLYSVDPSQWYQHEIIHPKFVPVKKDSLDALLDLYWQVGPFGMAVVDGNHEVKHTTYEYSTLWDFLLPGGKIYADDFSWSNHGSWQKFCSDRSLTPLNMGSTQYVTKPLDGSFCPSSEALRRHETYLSIATKTEEEWLAAGNKKHPAFDV